MCGIYFQLKKLQNCNDDMHIKTIYKYLYSRGPNAFGIKKIENDKKYDITMIHSRLTINGESGSQPIVSKDGNLILIINGEIFNWKHLQEELNYTCTQSDCEIILPLYEEYKRDIKKMLLKLNGQFSFVLYDKQNDKILIARDQVGITPMYIGYGDNKNNIMEISSNLKCLYKSKYIDMFLPRTYIYDSLKNIAVDKYDINSYTNFEYYKYEILASTRSFVYDSEIGIHENIRSLLVKSVESRLVDLLNSKNCDFGVLLSGGLDSSLIASIVVKLCKKYNIDKKVKTFSIGVHSDVPDLVAARKVAEYLGTEHTEYHFKIKEGISEIENVIWNVETYDCTTIRASIPMYLLCKNIKQSYPDIKVLFSGELSDELLCYLYGANAPSLQEFQDETVNLVENVYQFDCLRADKTSMANSVEIRVPFTDSNYMDYILRLHPKYKIFGEKHNNKMEKQILRDSFKDYLPDDILYRKKEQFSDGVSGYNGKEDNLIDALKDYCNKFFNKASVIENKEEMYYKSIFYELFPNNRINFIKQWVPKWSNSKDPSGRSQEFWIKN